jgi:imidazole glycerol-phosphate synthase subunit HisH
MTAVTVVDYGIGNLYSVQRALEVSGGTVCLASDAAAIAAATHLVLPGVGAFADGMQELARRGLVEPLRRYAASGRPLLGICLGAQMLADSSVEFGQHAGLGLIPGCVVDVPSTGTRGQSLRIPHIGWGPLQAAPGAAEWQGSILEGTAELTPVYLVHSYHLVPADVQHLLATCDYGGNRITAAVRKGNVTGCQFHPEKSGPAGLAMLSRFLAVEH